MASIVGPASEWQGENGLARLSEEFRQVVVRIQAGATGVALGGLGPGALASVTAAERAVDDRALDLQHGAGDWGAWRMALVEYETVWQDALKELGERQN
jgi:hypothetical protein